MSPPIAYDRVAKWLHWVVFLLVFAQFVVAIAMPAPRRGTPPATLNSLHMSLGVMILVAIVGRWLWRLGHPVVVAEGAFMWEQPVARITHLLLYALLAVSPILGWANASARDWPITLFGMLTLPHLVPARSTIGRTAGAVHVFLAWTLLALIGLHIAAALYHYFIRRDQVLERMLPKQ